MAFVTSRMSRLLWFLTGFRVLQVLLTFIVFFTVVTFRTSPTLTVNCEFYENSGWNQTAYECMNEIQIKTEDHRFRYDVSFPFADMHITAIASCVNLTQTTVTVPTGHGSHVQL